ncbi:MAG: class I tRNA ligase family protein, partial [Oscillospiraceae bacterium]|nr:class I tRNA ligase family protein [Oscillospiraceae bacterium]
EVKRQIEFMKENRELLQFGKFYRLRSPFEADQAAWIVVSEDGKKAVLEYERHMSKFAFHQCTYVLDSYIRNGSKYMAKALKPEEQSPEELAQVLANLFYIIRIAGILLHPFAPFGTEKLREYLQVDETIRSWEHIFEPLYYFTGEKHQLKYLPPRTDFFTRHESQFSSDSEEE